MPSEVHNNTSQQTKGKPLLGKRSLIIILIIIAQFALVFSVFGVGYKIGQDVGRKDAAVEAGLSGFNSLLSNISNPFRSTTGSVSSISASNITVKTSAGEEKTARINDKTRITRRSDAKSVSDIKKDMRVTVFYDDATSEATASRIIINE
jgi:hypothetical protein